MQAHAQLSLASAVDLAFRSNPKVLEAQAEVDRTRALLSQAKDAYVPVVGVNGGVGKSTGVPLGLPTVFNISAQSLVFNWSQRHYIKAAHLGWNAAQYALQQAQDDAAEDVITTYLELDNAQRRREAAQAALEHAHNLLRIVNDRVSAGTDAHIEIPRADLTVVQIEQQLAHTDTEIAELSDHLARLTGLKGTTPAALHDSIPALPLTSELTTADPAPATSMPAIQAAYANAQAKMESARAEAHYNFLPQVAFGAQYARITTSFSNYAVYYPGFDPSRHPHISYNALSLGVNLQIPVLDQGHRAKAREAAADARKAQFEAVSAEDTFLEGRLKVQRAASDLDYSARIAADRAAIAQDELDAVLIQLQPNAVPANGQPLTPKDEQNARLAVAQRQLDLLTAEQQLEQAKISLMRQSGHLHTWLQAAIGGAATAAKP